MTSNNNSCPCGSNKQFNACCEPYISNVLACPSPEALMRSRFSAYSKQEFDYILYTYSQTKASQITLEQITEACKDTNWLSLQVLNSCDGNNEGEVEFIAHYQVKQAFFIMHERSRFVYEAKAWRYVDGDILSQTGEVKLGRNDPCLCNSGRKYKRCCGK